MNDFRLTMGESIQRHTKRVWSVVCLRSNPLDRERCETMAGTRKGPKAGNAGYLSIGHGKEIKESTDKVDE